MLHLCCRLNAAYSQDIYDDIITLVGCSVPALATSSQTKVMNLKKLTQYLALKVKLMLDICLESHSNRAGCQVMEALLHTKQAVTD